MTKPELDLGIEVIKYTFDRLPVQERIRVVRELERETRRQRWEEVISKARRRSLKNPISQKEISAICKKTRQQLYAKRIKGRN